MITNLRQNFSQVTEKTKNDLVKQFEPLINKITAQMFAKISYPWDDSKSMAYEGFVLAINQYDPEKSSMDFKQYAGFSILNNIRNRCTEECRTVRQSGYSLEKARKEGRSTFTSVRINTAVDDDERTPQEVRLGIYENEKFSNGDVYEYLYSRIDEKFNETDRYFFYAYYGLKGYNEMQVSELAEKFGVTSGRISQRIKKVIRYIQKDEDLCEMLSSL